MGRKTEDELRELRAAYEAMVEHAPEALVVFDLDDDRFVEANPRACKLFGLSREEILKVGPATMSPTLQPDGTPSALKAPEMIQRAMDGDIPWFEWTHVNAAGEPLLCRIQLVRVPSEQRRLVRASVQDIARMVESERMRERLLELLDATPDLVGLANAAGRVQYVNPAGRELLEIPADEDLSGRPVTSFHTEESGNQMRNEAIPAAIRDGIWRGESTLQTRSGERIPVSQVVVAHRNARGEPEHTSTIARDIRAQRAAEQLERNLLQAQKLESLGVLAGGIAHDFNNILVGVLTNASLARTITREDETREILAEIEEAGKRAAALAKQMLDYAGKSQARPVALELPDVAREVSRLLAASISKNARVQFEFADDVPPVLGDENQLGQVLMNLILNASDSLQDLPGEITVRTALARVDRSRLLHSALEPGADGDLYVMLEVRDSGSGIDAPLDRIFDPFFTTKFAGRGLGLAAVLGIVKSHRGAIEVDSAPERGTAFRLWFPPLARTPRKAPERPRPERSLHGTVLIVDDEDVVRIALTTAVASLGFEVLTARDGASAEAALRESDARISAVLLDLTMPGMSGQEVLERLRAIQPQIPVILMSGYSDRVEIGGADAFVAKPFTVEEIDDALRAVIG